MEGQDGSSGELWQCQKTSCAGAICTKRKHWQSATPRARCMLGCSEHARMAPGFHHSTNGIFSTEQPILTTPTRRSTRGLARAPLARPMLAQTPELVSVSLIPLLHLQLSSRLEANSLSKTLGGRESGRCGRSGRDTSSSTAEFAGFSQTRGFRAVDNTSEDPPRRRSHLGAKMLR